MAMTEVPVERDLQAERRAAAAAFRDGLTRRGILCINMISSPGAGKTTLLQSMAKHWEGRRKMAVLVGDIATDRDAKRLEPFVAVRQLTTGGACHLALPLVERGLGELDLTGLEFLVIENVGNLVCPSSHDLGEHLRVVVLSVTEGDDKPGKYPKAFRTSQACVINKMDLIEHVPFSVEVATADARLIQPEISVFPVSAWKEKGIAEWCTHLERSRETLLGMHACHQQ
jgi:hydrogenase nickel incorporation protein HypB